MSRRTGYEPGQLHVSCGIDGCDCDELPPDYVSCPYPQKGKRLAFLPHSCDEWIVGDAAAVRALINDLEAALKELES